MICKDAARILLSEFREAEVIRFLHEDFGPGWQVIFQRREGSYEVLTKSDTISCGAEGREGWEPWHFDDEECGLGVHIPAQPERPFRTNVNTDSGPM